MSRRCTENRVLTSPKPRLALHAHRLHERSKTAAGPRAQMLRLMSQAYSAAGLAESHYQFDSDDTAIQLMDSFHDRLASARGLA